MSGPRPSRRRRIFLFVAIAGVAWVLLVGAGVLGLFWWFGRGVASLDEDRLKNYRPPQVTRILASGGEVIGELYSQRRTLVDYEDIPGHVEDAFLAAEDADFYRHEGMDYMGMVRALVANLKAGRIRQGASTITQQVVKIFMLSSERSFERKVQELILARRLEQAFTKQEILELYLNEIYLGHGRYGIEEASRYYFGRGIADIDLGQAALLATLPKAPGRDSPFQNPQRAKERQKYVLRQMVEHGFVSAEDIAPFVEAPLRLADPDARSKVEPGAEEFVDEVERILVEHFGEEALMTMGAEVTTTVDLALQRTSRSEAIGRLGELDRRQRFGRRLRVAGEEAILRARRGAPSLAAGVRGQAVVESSGGPQAAPEAVTRRLDGDLRGDSSTSPADGGTVGVIEPYAAERPRSPGFSAILGSTRIWVDVPEGSRYDDPEQSIAEQFPPGAIVSVVVTALPGEGEAWPTANIDAGPECAALVLDVESGDVLAMLGGTRYRRGGFNRALAAKRQPGSTFKPFVYGAALQSGRFTAATLVSDSPEIYEKWRPTNFKKDSYLGDVRVRVALTKSINTVAIKLLDQVGIEAAIAFARAAGIVSDLPDNLSLALGTGEVAPFEIARSYLTLARGGRRMEPRFVREVRLRGESVWEPPQVSEQVIPADVVFVLTSMMSSVVEEGTARGARALERPAAGKTGTSAEFRDAWFAGFTPERVGVAWVGFDHPASLGNKETGGKAALPIWLAMMQAASTGSPRGFVPPAEVSVRRIDAASGLLAPTGSAAEGYEGEVLEEFFVPGTEPTEEAVPAALPVGDVLLDLYGDAAEGSADDEGVDGEELQLGASVLRAGPTVAAEDDDRHAERLLPSLDEDM